MTSLTTATEHRPHAGHEHAHRHAVREGHYDEH
jgi:hypothetical protein